MWASGGPDNSHIAQSLVRARIAGIEAHDAQGAPDVLGSRGLGRSGLRAESRPGHEGDPSEAVFQHIGGTGGGLLFCVADHPLERLANRGLDGSREAVGHTEQIGDDAPDPRNVPLTGGLEHGHHAVAEALAGVFHLLQELLPCLGGGHGTGQRIALGALLLEQPCDGGELCPGDLTPLLARGHGEGQLLAAAQDALQGGGDLRPPGGGGLGLAGQALVALGQVGLETEEGLALLLQGSGPLQGLGPLVLELPDDGLLLAEGGLLLLQLVLEMGAALLGGPDLLLSALQLEGGGLHLSGEFLAAGTVVLEDVCQIALSGDRGAHSLLGQSLGLLGLVQLALCPLGLVAEAVHLVAELGQVELHPLVGGFKLRS